MWRLGRGVINGNVSRFYGDVQYYGLVACSPCPSPACFCCALLMLGPAVLTISTRVGQNPVYTSYMTVCMVIFLLKIPFVHRIYL